MIANPKSLISAHGLGFGRDDSSVMKFVSERVDLDAEVGFHSLPSGTTSMDWMDEEGRAARQLSDRSSHC
jgi:hypothetical protein